MVHCYLVYLESLIQHFEAAPNSISYHSHLLSCSPSYVSCSHSSLLACQPCFHLRTLHLLFPCLELSSSRISLCSYSLSSFTMYQFPSIHVSVHDAVLHTYLFVYHQSSSLEYKLYEAKDFDMVMTGSPALRKFPET